MRLALQCPTCGASHSLRNPGVVVVVCEYCRTTLYREGAALRAGKRSLVAEPPSAIRVGETGRVQGERVTVLGRVQFEHDGGRWDEWLLQTDDGSERWLVEDEKQYTLEIPFKGPLPSGAFDASAGDRLLLGGSYYSVRWVGQATCTGGEGQLQRDFLPGETYRYVDGVHDSGRGVFTLEKSPKGALEAWIGRPIPFAAVQFTSPSGPTSPPPRAGATPMGRKAARAISCTQCGGSLPLPEKGNRVLTLGCLYCDAVLNLAEQHPRMAGYRSRASQLDFSLEIGDSGTIRGESFEVLGRLVYSEAGSDRTWEYLLWSEKVGYRWLDNYCGNWSVSTPVKQGPSWSMVLELRPKEGIEVAGTSLRFFERGSLHLDYVDGALPWAATIGETTNYATLIAPPIGLTLEKTGNEVECFRSRHVDGAELLESFGRQERHAPPWVIGALTPNPLARWELPLISMVGLFALLNLVLAAFALAPGTDVMSLHLPADWMKDGVTSLPFEVPEGTRVLGLHTQADVDNSWVYVTGELLDASGESVVAVTGQELSRYEGYEGGEKWTEGSRSDRRLLRSPPAGSYRMAISREGDESVSVNLRLTRGDRTVRYPLILGFLLLLYPLVAVFRSGNFENRRWGGSGED